MAQTRVNIRATVNAAKIRRERRNGRDVDEPAGERYEQQQ